MATKKQTSAGRTPDAVDEILETLSANRFDDWYRERQRRQNIENGTPYFNGACRVPHPERHSPSSLLQCHRKILYRQCNAPAEQPDPDGIFWFGTRFEEDVVFPFLERAVTDPGTYVRNTMWIDTTVETDAGDIRIKGATDPVIVDEESVPVLPTEVKTKASIDNVDAPNRHHRAQVHAYLHGLSEKYDIGLGDAVILYGGRESLDVKVFHVEFDREFWADVVLEWASKHTQYRLDQQLPPADPEYSWECEFCDFQERCGKGSATTSGEDPNGFMPLYAEYPRDAVIEYLEAHEGAKLTPTLAYEHPDLKSAYGSYDWHCPVCGDRKSVDAIEWDGNREQLPFCESCGTEGVYATLEGPAPKKQRVEEDEVDA